MNTASLKCFPTNLRLTQAHRFLREGQDILTWPNAYLATCLVNSALSVTWVYRSSQSFQHEPRSTQTTRGSPWGGSPEPSLKAHVAVFCTQTNQL